MELTSQKLRKIAPELDPLRLGTGWKLEDLSKPQIMIESTFGDSHPGSPSDCQIQSSYVPAYGLQKHGTCGVDPQKLEKTGPFDP